MEAGGSRCPRRHLRDLFLELAIAGSKAAAADPASSRLCGVGDMAPSWRSTMHGSGCSMGAGLRRRLPATSSGLGDHLAGGGTVVKSWRAAVGARKPCVSSKRPRRRFSGRRRVRLDSSSALWRNSLGAADRRGRTPTPSSGSYSTSRGLRSQLECGDCSAIVGWCDSVVGRCTPWARGTFELGALSWCDSKAANVLAEWLAEQVAALRDVTAGSTASAERANIAAGRPRLRSRAPAAIQGATRMDGAAKGSSPGRLSPPSRPRRWCRDWPGGASVTESRRSTAAASWRRRGLRADSSPLRYFESDSPGRMNGSARSGDLGIGIRRSDRCCWTLRCLRRRGRATE